jgi:hypothetical protein
VCRSLERLGAAVDARLERLRTDVEITIHRCAQLQRDIDQIRKR